MLTPTVGAARARLPGAIRPRTSGLAAAPGGAGAGHAPAYLANLYRLGLIWFSPDPAPRALSAYQVLEAQPDLVAATKEAGRARIVRRSIQLTPFGEQFCALCLPAAAPVAESA